MLYLDGMLEMQTIYKKDWLCKIGLLFAAFLGSIIYVNFSIAQTISAGIPPTALSIINSKLGLGGQQTSIIDHKTCPKLDSKTISGSGRIIVEIAIVCNAVHEANLADKINLIHHLPQRRRMTDIAAGKIDISGTTIFPEGMQNVVGQKSVILTNAILRANEFEKAIFTLPNRADVLQVKSLKELRNFKAVIVKFWRVDIKTLRSMKLKKVVGVLKPNNYTKIMTIGRADFTISEFKSLTNKTWAKGMARVPGIKVALVSTRLFPVSPKRPDIVKAINVFVAKSRAGKVDLIRQAFEKSDFINSEFSHWKLLFPVK
ncbi:MAG: hypothetical protein HOG95_11380 [Rhodospirillaceae bacterium]|nr:hypothetical protein [Rhodospirillaceae bacterium]MBT5940520.1 hypothetical protein [Rhodospirillaceae bacterium]MBT7268801.1 hypothetical protein [Rhodospirillaceae bacterium]